MQIKRHESRLSYRNRRRRAGCFSFPVFLSLLLGIFGAIFSWNWIGGRLNATPEAASVARPTGFGAARAAFDSGNLDEAVALSQQLLAAQPEHVETLTLLARALVYRSYSDYDRAVDRETALQLTTRAFERLPNDPNVTAIHAFTLAATGAPVEAAQLAERILERDSNHGLARVAFAMGHGGAGSFEIALRQSLLASQHPDWQLDAQRTLALSYSDLGNYGNAIEAVERAIGLNSRLIPLYFERALYALQIGDADAATVAYFQVLTYDPQNVKARLRLCELSSTLRERALAIDFCQQVTERAPEWPQGWFQLGREYFLQGDFAAARDNLRHCSQLQVMQAVPVSERRFECWYLQGQAAEILGDCQTLVTTYNEFQAMAADSAIQQTWVYPPEGPPGCLTFQTQTP